MAKVYDALRRAEAERKRRTEGGDPPPVARLDWEPETVAPSPSPPTPRSHAPARESFLSRLLWWRRGSADGGDLNKRRISLLQPESYVAEQFRALRGRIDAISDQRPIHTVAVTSALPGEGKTTAAINLAIVTALSVGREVLLVDCDLRRPKVHTSLGVQLETGIAEVLTGQATLEEAVVRVEGATNLSVLGVRGRPGNPSELLGSLRMKQLVAEASERYDRVILDTPAALGLPDAKAVADLCDGLVMVVRADSTRRDDVQTVLEILDRRRVIGLLLNGANVNQGRYGYVS